MGDETERATFSTAHIDDLPFEIDDQYPTTEWKPVRRFFGIGSFGTNIARATQPGDVLTYDHTEIDDAGTRHEELFLIVSGHATYRVDGEEIDAPAGTLLHVPDPATVRGAVALDAGTTMLVVGGEPGAVFSSVGVGRGAAAGVKRRSAEKRAPRGTGRGRRHTKMLPVMVLASWLPSPCTCFAGGSSLADVLDGPRRRDGRKRLRRSRRQRALRHTLRRHLRLARQAGLSAFVGPFEQRD